MSSDDKSAQILEILGRLIMQKGFAAVTTEDMARAARISKRDLYQRFGSKQAVLGAVIDAYSDRMKLHQPLAPAATREDFLLALQQFGEALLTALMEPERIAYYRLAIAEAERSAFAEILAEKGIEPVKASVTAFITDAIRRGLIQPAQAMPAMDLFFSLLSGQGQLRVLLGLDAPMAADAIAARAALATRMLDIYLRSDR